MNNKEKKLYASVYSDYVSDLQLFSSDNMIEIFLGDDRNTVGRIFYLKLERDNDGKITLWVDHKKVGELKEEDQK